MFDLRSPLIRITKCLLAIGIFWMLQNPVWGKTIDRDWVQSMYQGGELDAVKNKLQSLLKSRPVLSKADSIFVYKYMSVVTAADSGSKSIAKDYMYKLLTIQPSIDIIDMYVSESVYALFQDVRKEFNTRNAYANNKQTIESGIDNASYEKSNTARNNDKQPIPMPNPREKETVRANGKSRTWLYWTLGGVALTGAAISAYYLTLEKEPTPKTLSN
jgi:hypothetical protein